MTTHNQTNLSNSDNGESLEDLLAVYALGGLDDQDLERFEAELTQDQALQRELRPYQFISETLVLSGPPMQMSADSKNSLMSRVEANARARFGEEAVPATSKPAATPTSITQPAAHTHTSHSNENRGGIGEMIQRFFSSPLLSGMALTAALAFAIFVGVLGNRTRSLSNTILQQQQDLASAQAEISDINKTVTFLESSLTASEREIDELVVANSQLEESLATNQSEIDTLLTANSDLNDSNGDMAAKISDLEDQLASEVTQSESMEAIVNLFGSEQAQNSIILGTEIAPEAMAQIVYNPESSTAVLVVDGLSELERDQEYQILLIRGGEHDTADTFTVSTSGTGAIVINAPFSFDTFDSIGVSIEPTGGSEQRTGDIVLLGGINQIEVSG